MNDSGTRYVPGADARIEEGWGEEVRATIPVAEAAPAPPAVPEVAEAETEMVAEDGTVKFEIRQATGDQPAMVRMSGIDENANATFEVKSGEVSFRFTPKAVPAKPGSVRSIAVAK
jgi:hypothetical protein